MPFKVPDGVITTLLFVSALAAALFLHKLLYSQMRRMPFHASPFASTLLARIKLPSRLLICLFALILVARFAPISPYGALALQHILAIGAVALVAWAVQTAVDIWINLYLRRFRLDSEDNLLARKHVTQMRILRRTINLLIVVVAISAALMTFESVREYGVSLLASAGVAGIVVGLAMQPVLKNLFAGIQLALTQPIRIDDAVIVEGEWGNIEEITSTYVVIRIWDLRRLIVPLAYFIEKPFQNWTREEARLLGAAVFYLDYAAPLDEIRAEVDRIAKASSNWDGKVTVVQVTDLREWVMEVRVLASAPSSGRAFELRCEIREGVISFLREHYPEALPCLRLDPARNPTKDGRPRKTEAELFSGEHRTGDI